MSRQIATRERLPKVLSHHREAWADYFDSEGIKYAFFSAANATAAQEQAEKQRRRELGLDDDLPVDHDREIATEDVASSEDETDEEEEEDDEDEEDYDEESEEESDNEDVTSGKGTAVESLPQDLESKAVIEDKSAAQGDKEWQEGADAQMAIAKDIASRNAVEIVEEGPEDPRTRVLTVLELEELFESAAPPLSDFVTDFDPQPTKLMVGLVGYPNVGKSSTINALLGSKKVSVSATPGKTKHFQTLAFTDKVTLCDCPGLVFPQFVNTEAELVCDGVLPIDQMREASGPIELICRRIPREILEGTYGIRIDVREVEDGGTGRVGWEDLLSAYASTYTFSLCSMFKSAYIRLSYQSREV